MHSETGKSGQGNASGVSPAGNRTELFECIDADAGRRAVCLFALFQVAHFQASRNALRVHRDAFSLRNRAISHHGEHATISEFGLGVSEQV